MEVELLTFLVVNVAVLVLRVGVQLRDVGLITDMSGSQVRRYSVTKATSLSHR